MTAFGGALTDPTAVMGSRIGAYVVDVLVTVAAAAAVFFLFGLGQFTTSDLGSSFAAQQACDEMMDAGRTIEPDGTVTQNGPLCVAVGSTTYVADDDQLATVYVQVLGATLLVGIANQVLLPAMYGFSLGKALFGLRIVTANGTKAGFFRNLVRYVLLIVDTACCYVLPGWIVASKSKGHRRIGDMAASTFVIHRSAMGRLLHIPGLLTVVGRDQATRWGDAGGVVGQPVGAQGGVDEPVWDPSRNTYIRYDSVSGLWHRWDDATQQWLPVD